MLLKRAISAYSTACWPSGKASTQRAADLGSSLW